MLGMHGGSRNAMSCTHGVQKHGRTTGADPTVPTVSFERVRQFEQVAGILGLPGLAGVGSKATYVQWPNLAAKCGNRPSALNYWVIFLNIFRYITREASRTRQR